MNSIIKANAQKPGKDYTNYVESLSKKEKLEDYEVFFRDFYNMMIGKDV